MVGRLASRVTNAFDIPPNDETEKILPEWFKMKDTGSLTGVAVSQEVVLEAFDVIIDVIDWRGGECFGAIYGTGRLNPCSTVVTVVACSPYFGVQKLGRVAFDPDDIVIAIVGDGEQKIFLAEEYVAIWLAAVTVLSRPRDQHMETARSLAAECLEDR